MQAIKGKGTIVDKLVLLFVELYIWVMGTSFTACNYKLWRVLRSLVTDDVSQDKFDILG